MTPDPRHDTPAALGALGADLAPSFTDLQRSEPVNTALAQRVKRRVLQSIAAQERGHLTVQAAQGQWQPFGRGVQIKVLHENDGVMSYLLKLEPGAAVDAHRHPHDEECVVLDGTLMIGEHLVLPAGGFHLARQGALHDRIHTVAGATIFLRGAVPELSQLI